MVSRQVDFTSKMWSSVLSRISGVPECPECETVWNDKLTLKSDPLMDSCCHPKCRKCFLATLSRGRPCAQCCKDNPYEVVKPQKTRIRMNGVVSLVRCSHPSDLRKLPIKNEPGETCPKRPRGRPRKDARRYDDMPVLTEEITEKELPREALNFYDSTPSSNNKLSKLVTEFGKPKCPECEIFWDEPGTQNSGPVIPVCGHIKCRKCFISALVYSASCHQCEAEESGTPVVVKKPRETRRRSVKTEKNSEAAELKTLHNIINQPDLSPEKKIAALKEAISFDEKKFNPEKKTESKDLKKREEFLKTEKKQPKLNGQLKNKTETFTKNRELSREETPPPKIISVRSLASPEPRIILKRIEKNPHKSEPPAKKPRIAAKAKPKPSIPTNESVGKRSIKKRVKFSPEYINPRKSKSSKSPTPIHIKKEPRPMREARSSSHDAPKLNDISPSKGDAKTRGTPQKNKSSNSGQRKISCNICPAEFFTMDTLEMHQRTVHSSSQHSQAGSLELEGQPLKESASEKLFTSRIKTLFGKSQALNKGTIPTKPRAHSKERKEIPLINNPKDLPTQTLKSSPANGKLSDAFFDNNPGILEKPKKNPFVWSTSPESKQQLPLVKSLMPCPICNVGFIFSKNLEAHIARVHAQAHPGSSGLQVNGPVNSYGISEKAQGPGISCRTSKRVSSDNTKATVDLDSRGSSVIREHSYSR